MQSVEEDIFLQIIDCYRVGGSAFMNPCFISILATVTTKVEVTTIQQREQFSASG